jgi:hypothetical protein
LAVALAVEKLVPCILHMKLQITEKICHCIINSGLEQYGDSKFDCKKRKAYEAQVTECMRNKVFGNEDSGRVSQWKFRWKSGNRAMEKPSLSGAACNKILGGLQALAKTIFSAELDEEPDSSGNSHVVRVRNEISLKTWTKIASNLHPMWKLIDQHNDFSDNDLLQLHLMSNAFMCQWVDLYGLTHMTNYIHILGSGHLPYFAKKYGNLYRFSQQGWEAVNQLLKHYYFNNTNHGGSAGNGGKDSDGNYTCTTISGDHCRPLMRLCQRSVMWKLGLGEAYFLNREIEKKQDKSITKVSRTGEEPGTDSTDYYNENNTMFGIL